MVDFSERVQDIKNLIDAGKYISLCRARQYGKTTTLYGLRKALEHVYYVVFMDFEAFGAASFRDEAAFCRDFSGEFFSRMKAVADPENRELAQSLEKLDEFVHGGDLDIRFYTMFTIMKQIWNTADRAVVLCIDEVDSASNNQVFIDFLSQLRYHYQQHRQDKTYKIFQSVILSGVTDIRMLKVKLSKDPDEKQNSPWNIAVDFNGDMSLAESGIERMLKEYEQDKHTGMDTASMARALREYTNGYPFLVSRLCQLMDERVSQNTGLSKAWTKPGFEEALRLLLAEDNTLFQSLNVKLNNYPELRNALHCVLMEGIKLSYNSQQVSISQLQMYGFIRNENNTVRVANRIFETLLYNEFLSEEEIKDSVFSRRGDLDKNVFVHNGRLDMRKVLEHFIETYIQIFGPLKDKFKEKDGREQFLLYLKPIINGTGNYYIEAQTRDQTRTDVIVDYLGQQFVLELKIWRGERYNEEGEQQISAYLDYFGLDVGYMLSFNFNKKKRTGVELVYIGNKTLYEGTV